MRTLYVISHNIAGYMPESEPDYAETFADARECLIGEMEQEAENIAPDEPDPWGNTYAEDLIATADTLRMGGLDSEDGSIHVPVTTGNGPGHLDQWWHVEPMQVTEEDAEALLNGEPASFML